MSLIDVQCSLIFFSIYIGGTEVIIIQLCKQGTGCYVVKLKRRRGGGYYEHDDVMMELFPNYKRTTIKTNGIGIVKAAKIRRWNLINIDNDDSLHNSTSHSFPSQYI